MREINNDWETIWDQYADSAAENPAQSYRRSLIVSRIFSSPLAQNGKIVDLGSGQGDFLKFISQIFPSAKLLGVELSQSGIRIAQGKVPHAKFIQHDFTTPASVDLDPTEKADVGVCSEVLEHVTDPVAALTEIKRFLKPKSDLIVTVPAGPRTAFDIHIGHLRHYTVASLSKLLTQSGYTIKDVRGVGFPFFNLYRLVVLLRGKKVIQDVSSQNPSGGGLAQRVMRVFDFLFRFNLPFLGWQLVAVAQPGISPQDNHVKEVQLKETK